MTDDRLRALDRAAAGDPQARARLLRELVRAGKVEERYVELAAYVGDPGACLIAPAPPSPGVLRDWLVGLRAWGRRPLAHAAHAIARAVLPVYEQEWGDESLRGIVDACEAWLRAPSGRAAARLEDGELVRGLGRSRGPRPAGCSVRAWSACVSLDCAIAAVWDVACGGDGFEPGESLCDCAEAASRCLSEEAVRAVVAVELLEHPEALRPIPGEAP